MIFSFLMVRSIFLEVAEPFSPSLAAVMAKNTKILFTITLEKYNDIWHLNAQSNSTQTLIVSNVDSRTMDF